MKKIISILLTAVLLCTMFSVFGVSALAEGVGEKPAGPKATISLANARGKIDEVIEDLDYAKIIVKQLSAENQKQFLADVMKAIHDMPGAVEEKAVKELNMAHAFVVSARKGNTVTLLAEVFATATPEALILINERFASDLMSREANPNVTYTDEQFADMAVEMMKQINERTEETENGGPRSGFAILMFLRASGFTGDAFEKFEDQLLDTLKHDDTKILAKEEWLPAALGLNGRDLGYEPILADADAGMRPDQEFVLVIPGPRYLDGVLENVIGDIGGTTPTTIEEGSILSGGNLWIIIGGAVVLVGALGMYLVMKKKKPVLADEKNEE